MKLYEVYKACASKLAQSGIEDPEFNAQCLMQKAFGVDRVHLIACSEDEADNDKIQLINRLAERRINREPLQYILGSWSFMGFELKVGEGVLIPRDDTEVVTQLCLDFLDGRQSKNVIDLCSGSGAIAIALDKISGAQVTAVELENKAFDYLNQNIGLNDSTVKAFKGDVFSCHSEFSDRTADLIVSNPPYIISSEIAALQPEVQKEPKSALDGGEDGYKFYRAIARLWNKKIKSCGALAFELGEGQAETVKRLMLENGFDNFRILEDFSGVQRAIIGTLL